MYATKCNPIITIPSQEPPTSSKSLMKYKLSSQIYYKSWNLSHHQQK